MSLRRVLVANRGEIAVRVARACDALGIAAVGVYSEADAEAFHVSVMHEAVPIGPAAPRESYLNAGAILEAARKTGCDAIHPGYGFLSERASFADAVRDAGFVFVGPSGDAMRKMGTKTAARATMSQSGVPIVPGTAESDVAALEAAAERFGYPVLVKAAAGGGGKGMRIVGSPGELREAVESASREAHGAFGDARVYLEKYLARARHVEIQVFADTHDNVVHLFERECSVQRRHQKVIEESPSPLVDAALRERMGAAAVAAARAVGYTNAGTVEFLVDDDRHFYFLEMNTRLQVEHGVTELVVGVDLVEAQLRVAAGERLPWRQEDLAQRGHAIEARVYAEDAAGGHLPQAGKVLLHAPPTGPGIRVDAGIESGSVVPHHYDPLLAKLLVWGESRAAALRRLDAALERYAILGITTNVAFLRDVARHEVFARGEATTRFLEEAFEEWPRAVRGALRDPKTGAHTTPAGPCAEDLELACVVAAIAEELGLGGDTANGLAPNREPTDVRADPWATGDAFRLGARG